MSDKTSEEARWKREIDFFDRDAELEGDRIRPVDPFTLERYGKLQRPWFSREYQFRVLGSLAGKHVLDVGCGDGVNAVNFAKLGARVTGIDISPKAIELARRRMVINGVGESVHLECAPLERASFPDESFDIIWGDAILHHLIPRLDDLLPHISRWAKPGAIIMFAEPVNLSAILRQLRLAIPIATHATPDERPLERAELDLIRRHIPGIEIVYFSFLARLNRFLLKDGYDYEGSSPLQRGLSNVLSFVDHAVLSVPALQFLAGTAVIHGRKAGS